MSCNFSHPGIFEQRIKGGQWVWEELLFGDYCPMDDYNDDIPLADIPGVDSTKWLGRCWMNPDSMDTIISEPVTVIDPTYALGDSEYCPLNVTHIDVTV